MARLNAEPSEVGKLAVEVTLARFTEHDRDAWLAGAIASLSHLERERVAAMTDADARTQHAVGRALIRGLGAASTGRHPSQLEVSASAAGKPMLADVPDLHVSVAHTGRLVVVASSWCVAVGVDAERASLSTIEPRRVAERLFSQTEVAWLHDLPAADVADWFASAWTIKEAVGKALGVGMVPALSGAVLERNVDGLTLKSVWSGPPADRWTIHQLRAPGADERIAVALPAPNVALGAVSRLTLEDFPG